MSAITTTTAQDVIDAVRRLAETEALGAVQAADSELRWVATSLRNAVEAIEAIDVRRSLNGLDETDLKALYSLKSSIDVIIQSTKQLGISSGRITANLRVLEFTKPSE